VRHKLQYVDSLLRKKHSNLFVRTQGTSHILVFKSVILQVRTNLMNYKARI